MKNTLLILLMSLTFAAASRAAVPVKNNSGTDTVKHKSKHPTVAIGDAEVTNILNSMSKRRVDLEKVVILKDSLKNKGIMVEQLMVLLGQFQNDAGKLESAEYAYKYTVNYKSYAKLTDIFASEESKAQLADFVRKQ